MEERKSANDIIILYSNQKFKQHIQPAVHYRNQR